MCNTINKIDQSLAPIAIPTYVRLNHLKQTISALQNNQLARKSDLYVFSDAPKPGDDERVAAVRRYLKTINGFNQVHIIERKTNNRVDNSRGGLNFLLERFGRAIFLEEDVVTAPGFLTFMNQALEQYESNDQVFSVVGYCPPINIPEDYQNDVFFLKRYCAWGAGIWKNRFDLIRYIKTEEYEQFASNKRKTLKLVQEGGEDILEMLKMEALGIIDATDVKAMYAQFNCDQYTVYPTKSLVQNIGHDGTGTHCRKSDSFNVDLSNKNKFNFPNDVVVDQRIVKANREFRSSLSNERNLIQKIKGYTVKWLGLRICKRYVMSLAGRLVQNK